MKKRKIFAQIMSLNMSKFMNISSCLKKPCGIVPHDDARGSNPKWAKLTKDVRRLHDNAPAHSAHETVKLA